MPNAEFEEKVYETALQFELTDIDLFAVSTGQVQEFMLGYDFAVFTRNFHYWRFFPQLLNWWNLPYPPGNKLDARQWNMLRDELNKLPPFKFNCFIQAKRPNYTRGHNGKAWKHWRQPYYWYPIETHQQKALEKLENIIGRFGIVTYACPVFSTYRELWFHLRDRELINSSNFVSPKFVHGHRKYSYILPGTTGVALSDPRSIEDVPFKDRINFLSNQQEKRFKSNSDFLKDVGQICDDVAEEDSRLKEVYVSILQYLRNRSANNSDAPGFAKAMIKISVFCWLASTSYFIGSGNID